MKPRYSRYYTYIRPYIRNKTVRTYSSLIFSLITITIFSVYAIRPTLSTIFSLQKSIEEQNKTLESLKTKSDNLNASRNSYSELDPDLKSNLISLLPYSPNFPTLIGSLVNLARASEASISGIQFQPTDLEPQPKLLTKTPTVKAVDFTLNVQGTYPNLIKFLDSFKKNDRLITLQSVNFTKPDEGSMILTINGKALYLKN